MGRPSNYTPELGEYVCRIIATHAHGLKKLSRMYSEFPDSDQIYNWLFESSEFASQYFAARQAQSSVLADSMLDLPGEIPTYNDKDGCEKIDSGMLGRARLDYEIKKWHASKMAPKIWGDAKQVEDLTAKNAVMQEELDKLRAELLEKNKKEY